MSNSKKEWRDLTTLPMCLFPIQGGRANGRGNGTINRGAGRGNGASGIHKSVNSLAIQDASAAEYTSIRKFRKVKPTLSGLKRLDRRQSFHLNPDLLVRGMNKIINNNNVDEIKHKMGEEI